MNLSEVINRLVNVEDGFTERKTEAVANAAELRKTLVAFANSVPETETAILFVGVSDKGKPSGLKSPDSVQKTIREVAERQCYPPISYQIQAFESEGETVLAVLVAASSERPHFAGQAFVRKGSESVSASKQVYEELISSRNSKAGKIIRSRDSEVSVRVFETDQWGRKRILYTLDCKIETCDAHVVKLRSVSHQVHFSIPLEEVVISYDDKKWRLMLETRTLPS